MIQRRSFPKDLYTVHQVVSISSRSTRKFEPYPISDNMQFGSFQCYIEGIIDQGDRATVKVKPKVMRQVVSFFHYNYPIIQIYLILISLACIFIDTYNMGFQVNTLVLVPTFLVSGPFGL